MIPTVAQAIAAVRSLGLACSNGNFPDGESPSLPYVVLVPTGSRDDYADNAIVHEAVAYDIQLYARSRSIALEKRLKAALAGAGVVYATHFTGDESNRFVLTYFSTTLRE